MTGLSCFDASFFATPAHYRSIGCESAHEYLIPANELAPLAVEVLLDAVDHIALEGMLILEPLILHALLTLGALSPVLHRSFVAADVDVLRGEECHDFI